MASGIKCNDTVKLIFERMKVTSCHDKASERLRLVTFTIKNDEITVEKTISECDLSDKDAFEEFVDLMKSNEPYYILYDCHYENDEGIQKEDLVFGSWIPECTSVKKKMIYSASRCAIKNLMKGLKHDMQMTDMERFCHRDTFAEELDKNHVKAIEGKPCSKTAGKKSANQ